MLYGTLVPTKRNEQNEMRGTTRTDDTWILIGLAVAAVVLSFVI